MAGGRAGGCVCARACVRTCLHLRAFARFRAFARVGLRVCTQSWVCVRVRVGGWVGGCGCGCGWVRERERGLTIRVTCLTSRSAGQTGRPRMRAVGTSDGSDVYSC